MTIYGFLQKRTCRGDMKSIIHIDQMFGRLKCLSVYSGGGRLRARCKCTCGTEGEFQVRNLTSGHTKSCGCLQRHITSKIKTKHGLSRTKIYNTWLGMIRRCYDPDAENYIYYGGRGIEVCSRWRYDVNTFFSDMGIPPTHKHSIDRIDNDGNYDPLNCRWADQAQQNSNKGSYK